MNETMPDNFLTYLASQKTEEVEKLYTFAMDSLMFSIKVHTYHFQCESGFLHEQYQKIYEEIREFADRLVEIVMSMGVKFKIQSKTYTLSDELFDVSMSLQKIENFRDTLIDLQKQYSTKISLENLFGDTIEKLDQEIGLIKNFK